MPKFAREFAGKYVLKATGRKSKQTVYSIWQFQEGGQATENDAIVGRWEVADASRIQITFADTSQAPVFLKPRGSSQPVSGSRNLGGDTWRWELTRLKVTRWEHVTEPLSIFGHQIPGNSETLRLYSNGRVNDPLGKATWSTQGRNLVINWGGSKRTVAVLAANGKSYKGKTTQPTGFRKTTVTLSVSGTLLKDGQ
jgi:hypothetical protein